MDRNLQPLGQRHPGSSPGSALDDAEPELPPKGGTQARAFTASYANFLIAVTSSLVVTPIFLHALGREQYGLWLAVSSWLAYLSLTNAGFPQATQNRAAEAYAQGRREDVARSLVAGAWATALLAVVTIALFILGIASGVVSSSSIDASLATRRSLVPVLALTAGAYMISLPAEQFRAVLRASDRVALAQMITAGGLVVTASAGIVAVWLRPTVLAFAVSQASVMVATALVSVVATVRVVHRFGARLDVRSVSASEVRSLLSPSFLFLVIALGGTLIWSTDNLVIAWHLGIAQVAPYAISLRLMTIGSSAIGAIVVTLLPSVTRLWATGEVERLRAFSVLATRVTVGVSAVLVVEFILVGRAFIMRWVGTGGLVSRSTFYVFVAIFFVRALAQSMELVVIGLSRHKSYAAMVIGEGMLNLVLSLVLVRHLGAFGVALGTLLAQSLCTGWFLPWWAMRTLGLRLQPLARSLLTAFAAALVAWLAGRTLVAIVPLGSWPSLVVVSVTVAAAYCGAYAYVGLTAVERRRFVAVARQGLARTGPR